MVAERTILLRIQHLQKCGRRITTKISSHLVDFIKQEHGVHATTRLHTVNNTARHRADIGTAMAADFGLVTHAAQRYARKFALNRLGNTACQARLAHARGTNKTEDRATCALRQRTHRKIFQNALLNLLQSIMVCIQRILRLFQIKIILGELTPGQGQQRLDIAADNSSLRRHRRHLHQAAEFLVHLGSYVSRHFQLCHLLLIFRNLGLHVLAVAQLLTDNLNLLTQIIFLLVLLYSLMYLLRNTFGNSRNLLLTRHDFVESAHTRRHRLSFQQLLLFRQRNRQITGHNIGQLAQILFLLKSLQRISRHLLRHGCPAAKGFEQQAAQSLSFTARLMHALDNLALRYKISFAIMHLGSLRQLHAR